MSTEAPQGGGTESLEPKPGYLTSAFLLWLATFVGGGVITFAIRRGLPQEVAESNRALIIDGIRELLPLLWLGIVGWLGRAVIRTRQIVTQAKAEVMVIRAKGREGQP